MKRHVHLTLLFSWIAAGLFANLAATAQDSIGETPKAVPSKGLIAEGTEWETPWFAIDSGNPGPVVLITGGIHGNEPAGAAAADQIRHWPVVLGKLVVVPAVNRKALEANQRRLPDSPKEESDLNRNFPKTGQPDEARTPLGKSLWQFVKETEPDWVIDLHEGFAVNRQNPKSVGSSILCNPDKATKPLFEHALAVVNASIDDPANLFVLHAQSRTADGSLTRAAMERLGATGAIFETTYNGFPLGVRVRQHRLMVHRLLRNLGMIENGPDDLVFEADREKIKVAIYFGPGVWGSGPRNVEKQLGSRPERFVSRIIGPAEVRNGSLDQFDVLVVPGGSGSKQAAGMGLPGREKVRQFVADGRGYIGICGGCYLACENFSWSLKILDAKTKSSKWKRGRKELELAFDESAVQWIGLERPKSSVLYVNGPVMEPAASPEIPDFKTLATFLTEVANNDTPEGIQVGSPAILSGDFGRGRVVGISPHPEQTAGLERVVPRLVEWAAGGENR